MWQTHQAENRDTRRIGCLGDHERSVNTVYQDMLSS
jgi:hypothetical protein